MSDPDHTASRLVAAAERLFAGGGEETTSLRAITREARSNAAAVHYHFGGRDELLRAVIDRHLGPLAQRRAELLRLAEERLGPTPDGSEPERSAVRVAGGESGAPDVPAIIEATVRPDLELLAALRVDRVQVARLLGRAYTLTGAAVTEYMAKQFEGLVALVLPMLRQQVPAVDDAELRQRLRLVTATVAYIFANATSAPPPARVGSANGGSRGNGASRANGALRADGALAPLGSEDVDEQVRRLVAFCAAGVSAPPSGTWASPQPAKTATRRAVTAKPVRVAAEPGGKAVQPDRKALEASHTGEPGRKAAKRARQGTEPVAEVPERVRKAGEPVARVAKPQKAAQPGTKSAKPARKPSTNKPTTNKPTTKGSEKKRRKT